MTISNLWLLTQYHRGISHMTSQVTEEVVPTFSPVTIRYVALKFSEITEFVIYSFNI